MPESAAQAFAALLTTVGPLTRPELIEHLRRRGHQLTDDQFDSLWIHADTFIMQVGVSDSDFFVSLPALLEGRIFTHRLDAAEIESDVLPWWPDFAAFWALPESPPFDRLDGRKVTGVVVDDQRRYLNTVQLAAGTLAGRRPGELIGIRVTANGLQLEDVRDPAPLPPALIAEVDEAFDLDDQRGDWIEVDELIWHLCVHLPGLLTEPLPPIDEWARVLNLRLFGEFLELLRPDWADDEDFLPTMDQ